MAERTASGARMIIVLTLIAACSAAVLAVTENLTRGPIQEAERAEIRQAIVAVLPQFGNQPDTGDDHLELGPSLPGREAYVARAGADPDSPAVGVAIIGISDQGYGGEIATMVGVLPDGRIHGLRVLRHTETPGLGSKVRDAAFLDQFKGKDARGDFAWQVEKDGGDVISLTAATITSRAAAEAIRDALEVFDSEPVQAAIR